MNEPIAQGQSSAQPSLIDMLRQPKRTGSGLIDALRNGTSALESPDEMEEDITPSLEEQIDQMMEENVPLPKAQKAVAKMVEDLYRQKQPGL